MDIEPIMDEVRDKCNNWFSYHTSRGLLQDITEEEIENFAEVLGLESKIAVAKEVVVWVREELRRKIRETKSYAIEQRTEYIQAFHAFHEASSDSAASMALMAVIDILHKRLTNVEGGDEE